MSCYYSVKFMWRLDQNIAVIETRLTIIIGKSSTYTNSRIYHLGTWPLAFNTF